MSLSHTQILRLRSFSSLWLKQYVLFQKCKILVSDVDCEPIVGSKSECTSSFLTGLPRQGCSHIPWHHRWNRKCIIVKKWPKISRTLATKMSLVWVQHRLKVSYVVGDSWRGGGNNFCLVINLIKVIHSKLKPPALGKQTNLNKTCK